jgi:hypothetical protein
MEGYFFGPNGILHVIHEGIFDIPYNLTFGLRFGILPVSEWTALFQLKILLIHFPKGGRMDIIYAQNLLEVVIPAALALGSAYIILELFGKNVTTSIRGQRCLSLGFSGWYVCPLSHSGGVTQPPFK